MLTALAIASLALLSLQVLLVAAVSAWRPSGNIYVTVVAICLVTAPLAFVSDTVLLGQALGRDGRLFLVLTHLALGGFLFHFITLPDRSVTLRILVELLLAPGQTLSAEALRQRYGVRTMIHSRLEQLSAGRFIEIGSDQVIRLTRKGLRFGRLVSAGRTLFRIASAN